MSNNKLDVPRFIDEKMVEYKFKTHTQSFLPRTYLDSITTREVITLFIEEDEDLVLNGEELSDFVSTVLKKGRRLFAICVFIEASLANLRALLANGLEDSRLPLHKKDFGSLSKHRTFVKNFVRDQKHFCTRYFAENIVYEFDDDSLDGFSIPIEHDPRNLANLKGQGAFGKVWEITVHSDHREFPCETNLKSRFAMKVIDRDEPRREQNFHSEMKSMKHPHLVKCLTSFTFGSEYHMIYQLANGDLEEFMEKIPFPSRVTGLTEAWLSQQLAGLAGALEVVHNPQNSGTSFSGNNNLTVPAQQSTTKTGYIHDIKPENILMFRSADGKHSLRLSDFSCAKIVEFIATVSGKRDSYKTATKTGTPIYRAPESSMGSNTSRPYDIWSLGCVYVEVLVWYTEGFSALEKFRNSRGGLDRPGGLNDEGFYHQVADGNPPKFALRDSVRLKIHNLSQRCTGELKSIAGVIPELLKINPKERIDAQRLTKKLGHLNTATSKVDVTKTNLAPSSSKPGRHSKDRRALVSHSPVPDPDLDRLNIFITQHGST